MKTLKVIVFFVFINILIGTGIFLALSKNGVEKQQFDPRDYTGLNEQQVKANCKNGQDGID